MTTELNMNADSTLLDFNMEDVADLPEFTTYPAGAHTVRVKIKYDITKPDAAKLAAGKVPQPFVRFDMAYVNPMELPEGVEAPAVNSMDSQTCYIGNEYGAGEAKAILKNPMKHFGTGSVQSLVEQFKEGVECLVVTKHSWDKGQERTADNARTKIVSLTVL